MPPCPTSKCSSQGGFSSAVRARRVQRMAEEKHPGFPDHTYRIYVSSQAARRFLGPIFATVRFEKEPGLTMVWEEVLFRE